MIPKAITTKEAAANFDQLCENAVNSQNITLIETPTGEQVTIVSIADLNTLYQMIAELGVTVGSEQAGRIAEKFQAKLRDPGMVDKIVDSIIKKVLG